MTGARRGRADRPVPRRRDDVSDSKLWRLFAVERKSLYAVGRIVGMTPHGVAARLKRRFPDSYPIVLAARKPRDPRTPTGPRRDRPGVDAVWRLFAGARLNVRQTGLRCGLSDAAVRLRLRLHPLYRDELRRRIADPEMRGRSLTFALLELERLEGGWRRG